MSNIIISNRYYVAAGAGRGEEELTEISRILRAAGVIP